MRAVVTRVASASVKIDGVTVGEIGKGFLILLGVGPGDGEAQCRRLAEKALGLRVFEDGEGRMNLGLEQLTAVMLGGDSVEVKAVIAADLLVLQPIREQVVTGVKVEPLDMQKLQQMPGIVGYIVQPGDSLWKIAKKFHTTVDNIKETNGLTEDEIRPGDKLVLIKEI